MPDPKMVSQSDAFHAACKSLLEGYIEAIEEDMNRYAEQNAKPMDDTFAHNDLTKILGRDVPPNMLAGMAAEAIIERIARKRRGKGR